jgi:hypothetical protein
MAPEPRTIALTPANMSLCELRSEIARRFGVPPEQQRLVVQGGEGGDQGGACTEGQLVGEGSDPSTTVWGSGVRAGMHLLLAVTDPPATADEGTWSVERVVGLRREGLQAELARANEQRAAALSVGGISGGAIGAVVGTVIGGVGVASGGGGIIGGGFVAGIVGCVVGFVDGCIMGCVAGYVGDLAAALEGRNYEPVSRARMWSTRGTKARGGHAREGTAVMRARP